MAGRFREEEVGQKIWAKKGTSLQPAGCQPPLHPSINGGASVGVLAEWYGVGRARLNKPIPTRPPLLPELARAKDINQGGGG